MVDAKEIKIKNLKELSKQKERLAPGHRMCPGCGAAIIARMIMHSTESEIVVANATGCLEVSTTIYPYTSWRVPWIHNAFENAAATLSGVETAFRSLKKKNKTKKDIKFLAFGGDGGTYDIGLQSLSAALERGHDFVYVCYDNEAYMNTGIQRSSATPYGASTKTDPAGKVRPGKLEFKKDLMEVVAGHGIPYLAQASPHNWADLMKKAKKAFETPGPAFLLILSPCIPGWGMPNNKTIEIAKLAVDTNFWPLYEIENGKYTLNYDPKDKAKPIIEWLKSQNRFKHLLLPKNSDMIQTIQDHADKKMDYIRMRASEK